jgi:hypothetical protein
MVSGTWTCCLDSVACEISVGSWNVIRGGVQTIVVLPPAENDAGMVDGVDLNAEHLQG